MKKLFLCLFVTALTVNGFSQNQLGLRGGVGLSFAGGTVGTTPLVGIGFQHAFGDNVAFGGNLDFGFNGGAVGLSIEPAFDYYFNEVFDGFHLGLAAGVGLALSGGGPVAIPIQANIGYNIAVGDNFRIDIFAMPGVAIAGGAVTFGVTPGACFGYKF